MHLTHLTLLTLCATRMPCKINGVLDAMPQLKSLESQRNLKRSSRLLFTFHNVSVTRHTGSATDSALKVRAECFEDKGFVDVESNKGE